MRAFALPWVMAVGAVACHSAASSQTAPAKASGPPVMACPSGTSERPNGPSGRHIQQAVRRAGPGGVVQLSGDYRVDQTIELLDGTLLCSNDGATLTWPDRERPGMMISALRASAVQIRNLVLDGRGISVKGRGHAIEGNLIRNVQQDSPLDSRWGERHGIFIVDEADDLVIRHNVFTQIHDTAVIGFNVNRTLIANNSFVDLNEGVHLFSVSNTQIKDNTGSRLRSMSIEIQGDNRPGLVIENNRFKNWHPQHIDKTYTMSVVSGIGAIVRGNVIEGTPGMWAGLEVGGEGAQIINNTLSDADLVIAVAPDAVIRGNKLVRARIHKDVNRVPRGRLLIEGNVLEDPPKTGVFVVDWGGYDQVTLRGNRITKRITEDTSEFVGIVTTAFHKQPMLIADNVIRLDAAGRKRPIRAVCFANSGYQGNLKGLVVSGNTCDGGGVGMFGDSNSLGGHAGVQYQRNRLINLQNTITGDTTGLQAADNEFTNVNADQARLRR